MKVGSLFSGIGGFDLAAEALGWRTEWFVEIDPNCQHWLSVQFPDRPIYPDVRTVDYAEVPRVDLLCAGFPCQPHSLAGKRGGGDDERDLWPECGRAIRLLRPAYFVGENVPGILTSDDGRMFNRILSDLAALGYAARWDCLSAAECGAPHERDRFWIVAWLVDADHDHRRAGIHGAQAGARTPALGQRRSAIGGDPVGDGAGQRCERFGAGGEQELRSHAGAGLLVRSSAGVPRWDDGIPCRGADGTVRLVPRAAVEEIARTQPAFLALDDGVAGGLAGRGAAEAWYTPHGLNNEQGQQGGEYTKQLYRFGGDLRGSLWPVSLNGPGKRDRLRAIGNAVIPAWAIEGPFRFVQELEASR